jgi:hypothetical protein
MRIYRELKKLNSQKNQWPSEEMGKWTEQSFFKGRNPNGPKAHEKMLTIPGHRGNASQTTLRFHLTPVRIAIIKNTNNNKYWWGCGGKGTLCKGFLHSHWWWECKLAQPLWKTVCRFLK